MIAVKINSENKVVGIVYDSSSLSDLSSWILVEELPELEASDKGSELMWGENGLYYNYYECELEQPCSETLEDDYDKRVEILIAKKYSLAHELALHRQKDSKSEEFELYNEYCEQCKILAKQ